MNPKYVTSLELSKKLKELGVPQESMFYWVKGRMVYGYEGEWYIEDDENYFLFEEVVGRKPEINDFRVCVDEEKFGTVGMLSDENFIKWEKEEERLKRKMLKEVYSAFLSDELMDILPFEYSSGKNGIGAYFCNNDNDFEEADTITNACAKMLIYLLEHKLITVEQIKKK